MSNQSRLHAISERSQEVSAHEGFCAADSDDALAMSLRQQDPRLACSQLICDAREMMQAGLTKWPSSVSDPFNAVSALC